MSLDAEFVWDSSPWDEMMRSIESKWDDIANRKKFGNIIATQVYKDVIQHFAKEEGPTAHWQSWSKAYAEHMRKVGKGNNLILQDTGRLRMSFTPTNWRSNSDGIIFFNNAKTKRGFPYAKAHDDGGPKLPRRQFMWLSDKGMDAIVDIVERWLNPENED